jgi:hypothetical protein
MDGIKYTVFIEKSFYLLEKNQYTFLYRMEIHRNKALADEKWRRRQQYRGRACILLEN